MFFVASRAVTDFPVAVAEDVAFCCIALRVASLVCSAKVIGIGAFLSLVFVLILP